MLDSFVEAAFLLFLFSSIAEQFCNLKIETELKEIL